MNALYVMLGLPAVGAILFVAIHNTRLAGWLNIGVSAASLAASVLLAWAVMQQGSLHNDNFLVDSFNIYLLVLTTFVGLTTAIFSRPYMQHVCEEGRCSTVRMRLYHSMFQSFMFTMLLALSTNNLGVLWVTVEGATLATVMLVSIYRTPEAVEAAWKYFILCGVGIAQALFGTILLYFAAQHVLVNPEEGLNWLTLQQHSAELSPTVMAIAFVFLLVGYGTKIGLVPLHQWLPDAHSEGPTPMSAMLSGLLLNIALYAVIRVKMLTDSSLAATQHPHMAGHLLMGFGLISFLIAGLFLHRQRDIKRLFSYSSIEHMGLATFAFGIGGPLATFAALLHMLVHSLTKSSIFITVGHATHIAGTQNIEHIRGLIRTQPTVGWGLLFGVAAIAGFPPFGIFTSEFLLLNATMQSWPWLSVLLLIGLGIAFAGLFRHLHPMVYGATPEGQSAVKVNMIPVAIQLLLVIWIGLAMPAFLAGWLDQAVQLISGKGLL
ncbi:MAG: hydrogenase 4 subunit F [gamma proteobacterium symbiont of Bathyaustriella thionipta]|nr:hydrogenase 4 subunit F [gamma proteobacterium symbiont of Bathyaustriella thionipta]